MFIHDIYILKASDPFDVKTHEEIAIDLELEKAPPCYYTLLTGSVLVRSFPIAHATVLLMDKNCRPLSSAITDENGRYRFRNIKPGKYHAVASAIGYDTSDTKTIRIDHREVTRLSFVLKKSLSDKMGIVYGKILEAGNGIPIPGANIYLKSSTDNDKTSYKTISNHSGQYLIYDIPADQYSMVVQKPGYMKTKPLGVDIEACSRINLYFDLIRKPENYKNTISGKIRFDEKSLSGVAVFLYRLDRQENETIVGIQETNDQGFYLFSNVESGSYIVKGKMQNSIIYQKFLAIE